jgi:hypothetical protein
VGERGSWTGSGGRMVNEVVMVVAEWKGWWFWRMGMFRA